MARCENDELAIPNVSHTLSVLAILFSYFPSEFTCQWRTNRVENLTRHFASRPLASMLNASTARSEFERSKKYFDFPLKASQNTKGREIFPHSLADDFSKLK